MNDPGTMSATELTQALRRREVSSRELLDHYLDRIEQDGTINAVITIDEDAARAQAAAADEALVRGEPKGLLCGLPMTVKDVIETAGLRTPPAPRNSPGTSRSETQTQWPVCGQQVR